jgi:thiamine pyrophosphate-dependent acetolactate synthase large subunit-like protein
MELLAAYEVDTVFGMAGTMTLEVYRGIARTGIRHVQCRNEQGASLMADGYARATGKPGDCTIIGGSFPVTRHGSILYRCGRSLIEIVLLIRP